MIHEETTTKLELPPKTENVVRVSFGADAKNPDAKATVTAAPMERRRSTLIPRLDELDFGSPWVLRFIAVLAILILSMLMI